MTYIYLNNHKNKVREKSSGKPWFSKQSHVFFVPVFLHVSLSFFSLKQTASLLCWSALRSSEVHHPLGDTLLLSLGCRSGLGSRIDNLVDHTVHFLFPSGAIVVYCFFDFFGTFGGVRNHLRNKTLYYYFYYSVIYRNFFGLQYVLWNKFEQCPDDRTKPRTKPSTEMRLPGTIGGRGRVDLAD